MTPAQREDYEERAAILEHDGGMSRADAERYALRLVCGPVCDSCGQRRRCVCEVPTLLGDGGPDLCHVCRQDADCETCEEAG